MATAGILLHIMQLSPETIFTTREVLHYGRRSAVDQCLHTMVKNRFIRRLAYGVFVRCPEVNPSIEEIARIKAAAFGKRIYKHATDVLQNIGILKSSPADSKVFATNGHSSGFESVRGPVRFHGIAQRKARLCEIKTGERVYSLWFFGNNHQIDKAIKVAFRNLTKLDKMDLQRTSSFMPAWLNDMLQPRYARAAHLFM
jgi:hypothetical protein